MSTQDSGLKTFDGQMKSSRDNLADSIESIAEKDKRTKPWQSANQDGQATSQDDDQKHDGNGNRTDDYWMAEGSVNATS